MKCEIRNEQQWKSFLKCFFNVLYHPTPEMCVNYLKEISNFRILFKGQDENRKKYEKNKFVKNINFFKVEHCFNNIVIRQTKLNQQKKN